MNKIKLFLLLIVLICISSISFVFAGNQITKEDKIMTIWLEWKVNNIYDSEKKKVIEYLKAVDTIFDVAKETQFVTNESDYGNSNPKNAIKIIENSLKEAKALKAPRHCMYYRDLTVKILQYIKNYHNDRVKFGENQTFWDKTKRNMLNQITMEAGRETEYYKILHKMGFYDHMFDEMQQLKLITKEEKNKFESESSSQDRVPQSFPGTRTNYSIDAF